MSSGNSTELHKNHQNTMLFIGQNNQRDGPYFTAVPLLISETLQDRAQSALRAVAQFASVAGQVGTSPCVQTAAWSKTGGYTMVYTQTKRHFHGDTSGKPLDLGSIITLFSGKPLCGDNPFFSGYFGVKSRVRHGWNRTCCIQESQIGVV